MVAYMGGDIACFTPYGKFFTAHFDRGSGSLVIGAPKNQFTPANL